MDKTLYIKAEPAPLDVEETPWSLTSRFNIGMTVAFMSSFEVQTFISYFYTWQTKLGFSTQTLAILSAAGEAGCAVAWFLTLMLSQAWATEDIMGYSLLLVSTTCLVPLATHSLAAWLVARFLGGVAMGLIYPALFTMLATEDNIATSTAYGQIHSVGGIARMVAALGVIIVPPIANTRLERWEISSALLAIVYATLGSFTLSSSVNPGSGRKEFSFSETRTQMRRLMSISTVKYVLLEMCGNAVAYTSVSFLPLHLSSQGFTPPQVTFLMLSLFVGMSFSGTLGSTLVSSQKSFNINYSSLGIGTTVVRWILAIWLFIAVPLLPTFIGLPFFGFSLFCFGCLTYTSCSISRPVLNLVVPREDINVIMAAAQTLESISAALLGVATINKTNEICQDILGLSVKSSLDVALFTTFTLGWCCACIGFFGIGNNVQSSPVFQDDKKTEG